MENTTEAYAFESLRIVLDLRNEFDFTEGVSQDFLDATKKSQVKLLLDDKSKNPSLLGLMRRLKNVESVNSEAELFLDIGFEAAT